MYLRPAKSPVGSGFFSVSDSIDFIFKKYSTRLNVNIVARSTLMRAFSDAQCSSKARLSSAKYMTSSQIGFLHALIGLDKKSEL